MPVMNCFESTRKIRAFESSTRLRPSIIVALTGLSSASAQRENFANGVDNFSSKPVRLNKPKRSSTSMHDRITTSTSKKTDVEDAGSKYNNLTDALYLCCLTNCQTPPRGYVRSKRSGDQLLPPSLCWSKHSILAFNPRMLITDAETKFLVQPISWLPCLR